MFKKFKYLFIVVSLLTTVSLFQNCSAVHEGSGDLTSQSVFGMDMAAVAPKFEATLKPILQSKCAACHGVNQSPLFAVDQSDIALSQISSNSLIDLNNPANSRFVAKLNGGHSGYGAAEAQQIQTAIQNFANELKGNSVDAIAPVVSITTPTAGTVMSGNYIASAMASDNVAVVGVQFYIDGNTYGTELTKSPYFVSINTSTLTNGSHTVSVKARDAAGNVTTTSPVSVSVNNAAAADTVAPTVSVTSPAANATVSATVTVTANASDNVGVASVQFYIDGIAVGALDTSAPYSVAINTATYANGAHAITAKAKDAAGNTGTSAAVNVTVNNTAATDTTAPTVSITSPVASATISATATITANASDNVGVTSVQFYVDGVAAGAADTTSPYSIALNTSTYTNGAHSITAKATDAAGNIGTSAAVSVTINNASTAPTYTWIATNILTPKCVSCHGASGPSAGRGFNTYARTMTSVQAGNATTSILYTTVTTGKMSKSPYPVLSTTDRNAIRDWINAGALNN